MAAGDGLAAGAGQPKSCKVEVGTIKVEASLKGVIEAQRLAEVSLRPEAWTMPLTVERVIEHGTRDTCLARAGLDLAGLSSQVETWWALQSQARIRSVSSA